MAKAEPRSITRRSLLAALALLPLPAAAAPLPAVAAPLAPSPSPDPIYAAVAAHERAHAGLIGFADTLAAAELAAWHAPRGQRRAANKRLRQAYADQQRLGGILDDATQRFAATVPTTLQGAAAALAYVRTHSVEGCPMCEEEECKTLLGSVEQAICRAAGLPIPAASQGGGQSIGRGTSRSLCPDGAKRRSECSFARPAALSPKIPEPSNI
jgi:hypothetical protein